MTSSLDLWVATVQMFLFLGVPAGVFLAMAVMRHRERTRTLDLIQTALESGQPLPPDLVNALTGGRGSISPDRRRGVLLLAAGASVVLIGVCAQFAVAATGGSGAVAVGITIASLGAIPACIGAALVLLSRGQRG